MESEDVGQLLQLLSEARSAGVLGDLLRSMDVQKGSGSAMNDLSKRRACQEQPVPESDSEDGQDWEQVPEVEVPQVISKTPRRFGGRSMERRMCESPFQMVCQLNNGAKPALI